MGTTNSLDFLHKPLALLLSIPVILVVLFLVALEDEGIYGCYMDNEDMEYCKDREQVFTYEECLASIMKDIVEGDDAFAREWCETNIKK
tara:strand:- start:481 stop:747 length:267 start_codon:yes stop_codon:yes gene_type:complete